MIGQLLLALELGFATFVLAAISVESARRPAIIVYALLAVHFWELSTGLPSTRVMGIGVSALDPVNLVAFAAAMIRMRRPRGLQWPLIGVAVMVLGATAVGVHEFGGGAPLGFREELYFIIPALFASTLKRHEVTGMLRGFWRFGLWMAVLGAVRWFLLALGVNIGLAPTSNGFEIARVINAGATLTVGAAAAMGTWRWLHDRSTRWYMPIVIVGMLVVVLFAQNRSVWVATAVMLLIVFVGASGRIWLRTGAALALGSLIVLVEIFGPGDTGTVGGSLTYAATNHGTWAWRLQRWHDVWSTHAARGPGAIIFGSGYGHAWVSGAVGVWQVSPHNGYIQIAVRIGLVGAILLFGTYAAVVTRLGRTQDASSRVLWVLTIGVLVYFIPYWYDLWSGLLLGASVASLGFKDVPVGSAALRNRLRVGRIADTRPPFRKPL